MKRVTACSQDQFIEKLQELNFYGPMYMSGHRFMVYHGHTLVVPEQEEFSVPQFRILLKEVENIISQEEWHF